MFGDGYWLNFQTLVPGAIRAKFVQRAMQESNDPLSSALPSFPGRRLSASTVPKAYLRVRPPTY
jgi:hypothetical protein